MESVSQSSNSKAPLLAQITSADLSKVFVGLGACVDPDGLASQLAMKAILESIPDAKVECFYRGSWDRAQNRTMREVLGLTPRSYSDAEFTSVEDSIVANYTTLIMVDGNSSVMPHGLIPDFIIDHHQPDGKGAKSGDDIRLIGSCSAIMWEYLMEWDRELLEGPDGAKLATALTIGIETDTDGMTAPKTSRLDWEAYAYCGARCDTKAYRAIKNYPRPSYQKDMEMAAWNDKLVEGTVLTARVGVIPKERKGIISSCADAFCGQGPIRTTLVGAMIEGDIHFSFRTYNTSINADDFCKKLTKHGGGKPGSGAGVIKTPEFVAGLPTNLQEEIFAAMWNGISHRAFEFTGDGARQES